MVLLSTHNICFGWEIRKLVFWYTLLTKVLILEYIPENVLSPLFCQFNPLGVMFGTSVKLFLLSICWIAKTEFSTHIFQLVLVQWENRLLWISRGLNLLSFSLKKNHFLWNFSLVIFIGNPSLRLSEVLLLLAYNKYRYSYNMADKNNIIDKNCVNPGLATFFHRDYSLPTQGSHKL